MWACQFPGIKIEKLSLFFDQEDREAAAADKDDAEDDVHDEDVPAEDTRYAGHVAGQVSHCAF